MMKFDLFVDVVKEKIKDFLPEEYQNATIVSQTIKKVNQELTALNIRGEKSMNVSPTIYLEPFYERYQEEENLEQVLTQIAEVYEQGMKKTPELDVAEQFMNGNCDKSRIIYQLINTEQNREMLSNIPSREFQDMSVVYRFLISENAEGIASVVITDELMNNLHLTEEELFQFASENTKELMPITIRSMNDVLKEMFMKDFGGEASMEEELGQSIEKMLNSENSFMYIISNKYGINGATTMLYEEGIGVLAEHLDEDLYILPSSIHESIAVPVSAGQSPEALAEMVMEVNGTKVPLQDRLSNNVYFFDKETREISMATDVPERRLDCYEMPARAI